MKQKNYDVVGVIMKLWESDQRILNFYIECNKYLKFDAMYKKEKEL